MVVLNLVVSVSMVAPTLTMGTNAKAMPIYDNDYSHHITAVELV